MRDDTGPVAMVLPDGILLEGGSLKERNGTFISFDWRGSVGGSSVQGNHPTVEPTVIPLVLPGTHVLAIDASLTTAGTGNLRLEIVDDYGRVRCSVRGVLSDIDGGLDPLLCTIHETAQLGWSRSWGVTVLPYDATVPVDVTVTVSVHVLDQRIVEDSLPVGLNRIEPFETIAEDGTPLRGHVYVPRGDGPFATVLQFSPYFNGHVTDRSDAQAITIADRQTIRWANHGPLGILLDAGFAVAMVNMRGTGTSGGCQTWFDIEQDGHDAAAVIEALAASAWSNGNVGMEGISWHGYSQYAALVNPPAALKAIAPSSAILDHWTLWTRNGALLNLLGVPKPAPFANPAGFYGNFLLDNAGWFGNPDPANVDHVPCPAYAEQAAAWQVLGATGDDAPFWQARRAVDILAQSEVPAFVTNGLLPYPREGHIHQIDGLWPVLPPGSVLMIGPWSHEFPDQSNADRYDRMLIDWYDHHLRGGPALVAPGVLFQDNQLQWHDSTTWPPASDAIGLWLSSGQLVGARDEVAGSQQTFATEDDAQPRPDTCPTQAIFVSPPLAEEILVGGNLQINLTLTSTAPDGNLAIYLWALDDVASCNPAGRGSGQHITRAVTDLRHRGNLRVGEPFPLGTPTAVTLESQPFVQRIAAGQRLVLAIGGDSGNEVIDKPLLPTITVHGDGFSAITIPVIGGELRFVAE